MFKKKVSELHEKFWKLKLFRVAILVSFFLFSLALVLVIHQHIQGIISNIVENDYRNIENQYHLMVFRGLLFSIPPLPLFFLLWFFRHIDTQDNLAKQQQNIHQSALFNAQALILKHSNAEKSLAIAQLKTLLRDVPEFRDSIYIALKAGLQGNKEWTDAGKLKADFSGYDLYEIDLEGAQLMWANLQRANLQEAYLKGANLQGTYFKGANLYFVNLKNARLQETSLEKANLKAANLQRANLQDADLKGSNLQGADLKDANLEKVDLQGANLQGADLKGANLENIDNSRLPIYDDSTKFSDDISEFYKNGKVTDDDAFKQDMLQRHRLLHVDDLTKEMRQKRKVVYI